MAIRRSTPLPFSPTGLSDTLDGTNVFQGAMSSLQNLIPDPTTKNLWQCRPASLEKYDFADFPDAGFVSIATVIDDLVYGMVATSTNMGKDEPFCYDLVAGAYIPITGVTNNNTPISPATTGEWEPPTMDLVGTKLIVTHPGYNGTAGVYIGWFDLNNPAAPTWSGGNLSGAVTFTTRPTAVKQFFGRAYYLVNPPTGQPSAILSDPLDGLTVTNASQVITFGDKKTLTALGQLTLNTQLGGIIQALMVFKGANNIYQVTGDPALSNLSINALNIATGTLAPRSIAPTPQGLGFMSPDGLRVIDFTARISNPIGFAGSGVAVPFTYAITPSRMAAACNANVYRISVDNGYTPGSPSQEFWYDLARAIWNGPHTFPGSCVAPWNNSFILVASGVDAKLWQSDVVQTSTSTFVENGTQMVADWASAMLPDTQQMAESAMIEATINMALVAGITVTVTAFNQDGVILDTVTITPSGSPTIWGGFQWGQALWGGAANALAPRQLQWTSPVVFRRVAIRASFNCASGAKIGDMFMRYQILRYLQQAGWPGNAA